MVVFPNCKINLGLNITGRRSDGFHDIETVFYPVPWTDILEIIKSDTEEFYFDGIPIDCPLKDNLCYKAWQLLKNDFNLPAIKLFLYKIIPAGAGLGGGSSDAAYTLTALNQLFSLGLSQEQLMQYASRLGSDCAFFIKNQAVFATGTGNVFSEITIDLSGYYLLIVKPSLHIATAEAFRLISPLATPISIKQLISLPLNEWKTSLINDFETPLFVKYPSLKTIKDKLYAMGALYASMSGSGSALYGLFDKKIDHQAEFPETNSWLKKL